MVKLGEPTGFSPERRSAAMADLFLPVLYGSVREARVSFPVAEFVTAELAKRPG